MGYRFWAKGALLLLLLALPCWCHAQNLPRSSSPAPLFWADGITQYADFPAYQKAGFNAVVVRLYWEPSPDGALSARDLAAPRTFAEEAAKRGLKIIYALPAAPAGMENGLRIAADSDLYSTLWTTWTQGAMNALKDTPNLVGWMLPDDPRGLRYFDDAGWKNWLGQNFASVEFLNRQWSASFEDLDDVSIDQTNALIANWRGYGAPQSDMSMGELQTRMDAANRKPLGQNWAFHPAALALAHARWEAYRSLNQMWVAAIGENDAAHPVFSGRLPDYAQLLSLPDGVAVAVPDLAPGAGENDIVTHNPQAIAIAQRGGKRAAIPVLSIRATPNIPAESLARLVPGWIETAFAHGANGIAADSWNDLKNAPVLLETVENTLHKLDEPPLNHLWGQAPVNTVAMVLTPLADGVTVQSGQPPFLARRGLYGFGEDLVANEPSDLVWALRWGTAFGGVDFLAPEDVEKMPLDRYTTVLMPSALSVSNAQISNLASYLNNGGVVVADLGLSAMQNSARAEAISPVLAQLFGVPPVYELRQLAFNLNAITAHPLVPSWARVVQTRPGIEITGGDGPGASAFGGPTGYSPIAPTASVLAIGPKIPQKFGAITRVLNTQLTANNIGRGYAVFAPFHLWTYWRPGTSGFDTFHGDLIARGALAAMAGVPSLVPLPNATQDGSVVFPELINHENGVILLNHAAPGTAAIGCRLQTSGAGDWLWSGGVTYFSNDAAAPIPGRRPAPVASAETFDNRARPITIYSRLEAGAMETAQMRPIKLQNTSGGPLAAKLVEENPNSLKFNVWPNSPTIIYSSDEWQPALGEAAPIRVQVVPAPGGLQPRAGQRFAVQVTDYAQKPDKKGRFAVSSQAVLADANGKLNFTFTGVACAVEVSALDSSAREFLKKPK